MTSQKKIEANRRNAQKSTGPKTPEGKARSRLNAVTHGLTARTLILDCPGHEESDEHLQFLHNYLTDRLQPSSDPERALVRELALTYWRYERACRIEDILTADPLAYGAASPDILSKVLSRKLRLAKRIDRAQVAYQLERWHNPMESAALRAASIVGVTDDRPTEKGEKC